MMRAHSGSGCNIWAHDGDGYYQAGKNADVVVPMLYDSGITSETTCTASPITSATAWPRRSTFKCWIEDESYMIASAISSNLWGTDASHPMPYPAPKILFGMPAYATSNTRNHIESIENLANAGQGVQNALTHMGSTGSWCAYVGSTSTCKNNTRNYVSGGAVFRLTTGAMCPPNESALPYSVTQSSISVSATCDEYTNDGTDAYHSSANDFRGDAKWQVDQFTLSNGTTYTYPSVRADWQEWRTYWLGL